MDVSMLRKSTERLIAILDLHDSLSAKVSTDKLDHDNARFKFRFVKENILNEILATRKVVRQMKDEL